MRNPSHAKPFPITGSYIHPGFLSSLTGILPGTVVHTVYAGYDITVGHYKKLAHLPAHRDQNTGWK